MAPCHLPAIDPTIDTSLARPDKGLPCELCRFPDDEHLMLLCDSCNTGWHTYCLDPPLPAVPATTWVCPTCTAAGVTPEQAAAEQAAAKLAGEAEAPNPRPNLFPSAATRRRDAEAQSLDGRLVIKRFAVRPGARQTQPYWGRLRYMGAQDRPVYFQVVYEDGDDETMTLAKAKPLLMPAGTNLPDGVSIPEAPSAGTPTAAAAALPASWPSTADPVEAGAAALSALMPGTWADTHLRAVGTAMLTTANQLQLAPPMAATALQSLLGAVALSSCFRVLDPFAAGGAATALAAAGFTVATGPGTHEPGSPLQPGWYAALTRPADAIVCRPPAALLDIALPLAARYARQLACVHAPAAYLAQASAPRLDWLHRLRTAGRLHLLLCPEEGAGHVRHMWVVVLASPDMRERLILQPSTGLQPFTL